MQQLATTTASAAERLKNSSAPLVAAMAKQAATVLILDYGSQYTQLICRRVRELGVYSVMLPGDITQVRT